MNFLGYCLSCLLVSLGDAVTQWTIPANVGEGGLSDLGDGLQSLITRMQNLEITLANLAKQTMNMQFAFENKIRTDGMSGVKQVREQDDGPENYYSNHHVGNSIIAAHSHSDFCRLVGMGEVAVVLNGIELQTRHNDYRISMKDPNSSELKKVIDIPYPDVPEEVLKLESVEDQILEMGQWFQAFKDQNYTVRDYRKYFKPVLCYLEGTWTTDRPDEITEPFPSDRHHLEAKSFNDLSHKFRLGGYTGAKSRFENFAHLPTTIMRVDKKTGRPVYAQFNYQILCHPLKDDLPVKYLHQLTDLAYQMRTGKSKENVASTRSARYKVYREERAEYYGLIDELMGQVPGLDNRDTNLTVTLFGEQMYRADSPDSAPVRLNEAFYSRRYKHERSGAMGTKNVNRGFSDQNLFVARTTQPKVAPMYLEMCEVKEIEESPGLFRNRSVCEDIPIRYSYAIPLEILYLTPLFKWNPYNLTLHDREGIATNNSRNGKYHPDTALNGTDCRHFYRTPIGFFDGRTMKGLSPADTGSAVWVLDAKGEMHAVSSSGFRAIMIDAGGSGYNKFRFPIAPVHGEGSPVWKELNALRDMILKRNTLDSASTLFWFRLERALDGQHDHEFGLTEAQLTYLEQKTTTLNVTVSKNLDHVHDLEIRASPTELNRLEYVSCDKLEICEDKHPIIIVPADSATAFRLNEKMMMMMMSGMMMDKTTMPAT